LIAAETFAHQVAVQLLQLSARSVAEACEILRGADHISERQRGVALEAPRELLLQLVLQANDFRHTERAEILHARRPYRAVAALTTRYTPSARFKGDVMGLRLKFNLVLLVMFSLGLGTSAYISYQLLQRNARDEVQRSAGLMMEAALSMRAYTVGQVRPHLRVVEDEFLPQSVPAFGATEIMNQMRKTHPDYTYKEAALNPTNPRNRATEWESDIINDFRNFSERKELAGTRLTPSGPSMFLARPLQIKDGACLVCHTNATIAPPAMVKVYGMNNGYGWKLGEVIGAQIVSVPMTVPIEKANHAFYVFVGSLAAVFVAVFIILNAMLSLLIVRPMRTMSAAADKISVGALDIPELAESGKDEVALLAKSFNRMRRSLEKALRLIDEK